jgi:predicted RNA methylase
MTIITTDQEYFFPHKNTVNITQILQTDVSLYSSILLQECKYIYSEIIHHYKLFHNYLEYPILTDATANCGGSVIVADSMNYFSKINAVEIDCETFHCLKHNLHLYSINVNVFHCDYINIYKNLKQDIIFIDPPWGGPGYNKYTTVSIYLSNIDINNVIQNIVHYNICKMIVLKVPKNFVFKQIKSTITSIIKIHRKFKHSYNIIFIDIL